MGIVKSMWLRDQEQGWIDPKKWVCCHCIGDDAFLRGLVRRAFGGKTCTYCASKRRRAAPLGALMDAIYRGVAYSYSDEARAGAPTSGEIQIEYLTNDYVVEDVADSQGLEWPDQLKIDIANSLIDEGWVHAPDGQWMGSHGHERLSHSWRSFAFAVKHKSRFHFRRRPSARNYDDVVSVHEMLPFLAKLVRKHRMLRTLPAQTPAFRVRLGNHPHSVTALGPPPAAIVPAGRMNPAGIPYFYLALDEPTALAEARSQPGVEATVGHWLLAADIHVLDLTHCLKAPSIFSGRWTEHDLVQFIYSFVDEISEPVVHDGREHIEYVPTQVISEFFAQSFTYSKGRTLDGIVFPSALVHGAQNLVLFPRWGYRDEPEWARLATLVESSHQVTPVP